MSLTKQYKLASSYMPWDMVIITPRTYAKLIGCVHLECRYVYQKKLLSSKKHSPSLQEKTPIGM